VRTDRRRLLGAALLAWGLIGVLLIATGLTVGLDVATRAETLVSSSDRALAAASASTRRAAEALDGVGIGVGRAQESSIRAAALADDASATLDALATSMSLSIFGTQPFLPLATNFTDSADEAAALADELEALGGSLDSTGGDTDMLADELVELAEVLEDSTRAQDPPPLRLGLLVVLAWIALPTIGALVGGTVLVSGRSVG
jgi:hypothetical protein